MSLFISDTIGYKTSAAVLPRIARADKSAVQECINVYGNMIWALAKQFTCSMADAEKAVPEIFNDIWKNAGFCDLEISDESVWIALIARRRLSEYALKKTDQTAVEILQAKFAKAGNKIQAVY